MTRQEVAGLFDIGAKDLAAKRIAIQGMDLKVDFSGPEAKLLAARTKSHKPWLTAERAKAEILARGLG